MDDREIIELCQRGHPAGFARLLAAYQERVYRTAHSFLYNREDARDVTQEVFLRTVRAMGSLDMARPLWPWLRRVTTNLSLNLLKRRTAHLSLDALPESAQPKAEATEPAYTRLAIREALSELPPVWRIVLSLRHQEELSYEEIARLTDLPIGTVKTYIFRGRRFLRERLAMGEGSGQ
ncbi:MAG: RNA polymerase sigma factor [Mycobacterium leprae]